MKLTVLSIAYPLAPVSPDAAGGSEQILSLLDRALTRSGHHSIVIACEGSEVEGTLLTIARASGNLDNGAREQAHVKFRAAIRHALRSWPIDLVHMHGLDFYHYLPPEGVPVLATLHLPPDWYPKEVFDLQRPDTYVHCVSRTQRRACPRSSILLPEIENGVPIDLLAANVRTRNFALALGRICPEKGYHLALDAAARASTPMVLAGEIFRYEAHERYYREQIVPRLQCANGTRLHFAGPVGLARKRRLLSAARCLLVPSLVPETSSLVTMEALACGTPVIAFPSGALADIVEHGRTGFLVKDVKEMAEAITAVDQIDREECRRVARESFAADRMIRRYLERYRQLAKPIRIPAPSMAQEASSYPY